MDISTGDFPIEQLSNAIIKSSMIEYAINIYISATEKLFTVRAQAEAPAPARAPAVVPLFSLVGPVPAALRLPPRVPRLHPAAEVRPPLRSV